MISGDPTAALAPIIAVILALALAGLLLLALGKNPLEAYVSMIEGAFGSDTRIFNTISRAVPLMLVAIGICIAFRGGVINIDAEGQLFVGAVSATAFAVAAGGDLTPGYPFP